jgi:hypothetical protein
MAALGELTYDRGADALIVLDNENRSHDVTLSLTRGRAYAA